MNHYGRLDWRILLLPLDEFGDGHRIAVRSIDVCSAFGADQRKCLLRREGVVALPG